MPMPQQSKGHVRNGSSNAENVKEQDLHVILVVFLWCWVPFTHSHAQVPSGKAREKCGFLWSLYKKAWCDFFHFLVWWGRWQGERRWRRPTEIYCTCSSANSAGGKTEQHSAAEMHTGFCKTHLNLHQVISKSALNLLFLWLDSAAVSSSCKCYNSFHLRISKTFLSVP